MQDILKKIQSTIRTLGHSYSKTSIWGKVLIFVSLLLILVLFFRGINELFLVELIAQNLFLFLIYIKTVARI